MKIATDVWVVTVYWDGQDGLSETSWTGLGGNEKVIEVVERSRLPLLNDSTVSA